MLSIQGTKEVSNIFVAEIFLELLANIFDTFIFYHTVYLSTWYDQPASMQNWYNKRDVIQRQRQYVDNKDNK